MHTPQQSLPSPAPLEPRGVYLANYLRHGRRVFYAVSAAGEWIGCMSQDPKHPDAAAEVMRATLDRIDPPRLVAPEPVPVSAPHLRLLPP